MVFWMCCWLVIFVAGLAGIMSRGNEDAMFGAVMFWGVFTFLLVFVFGGFMFVHSDKHINTTVTTPVEGPGGYTFRSRDTELGRIYSWYERTDNKDNTPKVTEVSDLEAHFHFHGVKKQNEAKVVWIEKDWHCDSDKWMTPVDMQSDGNHCPPDDLNMHMYVPPDGIRKEGFIASGKN